MTTILSIKTNTMSSKKLTVIQISTNQTKNKYKNHRTLKKKFIRTIMKTILILIKLKITKSNLIMIMKTKRQQKYFNMITKINQIKQSIITP
jgi:hypothetical protein